MSEIAFVVFALHMLADFPMQSDWMAEHKHGGGRAHFAHMGVHFVLYFTILWPAYGYTGAMIASFVAGCHGAIDWRSWVDDMPWVTGVDMWVDQSLHITSIALAVVWFA